MLLGSQLVVCGLYTWDYVCSHTIGCDCTRAEHAHDVFRVSHTMLHLGNGDHQCDPHIHLILTDLDRRTELFAAAGASPAPPIGFPRLDFGSAAPIPFSAVTTLIRPLTGSHRPLESPDPSAPACAICLDSCDPAAPPSTSTSCRMCPCSAHEPHRHRPTATTAAQWTYLRCGHRFHACCFTAAAGRHPSEIGPHSSSASLSCPVCHRDSDGLPARIVGYSGTSLTLLTTPYDPELPPEPPLPSDVPPPPPPRPLPHGAFQWCPLHDPSSHQMCGHGCDSPAHTVRHIHLSHHRSQLFDDSGRPHDLDHAGVRACVDCEHVFTLPEFSSHSCVRTTAAHPAPVHPLSVLPPLPPRPPQPPPPLPPPTTSLPDSIVVPPAAWDQLLLSDSDALHVEYQYMRYGTARTLSAESRTLFSHCATVLAEHIQSAPPDDRHRCRVQ